MSGNPAAPPETKAQQLIDNAAGKAGQKATDGASAQTGGGDVLEEVTNVLAVDPPTGWWVLFAFGILAAGTTLAYLVWRSVKAADFMPSSNYAVYAGLFVMALAIERILEPFSGLFIPTTKVKKARSNATAAHARLARAAAASGHPLAVTDGQPPAPAGGRPPDTPVASVARAQQAAAVAQKEFHRSQANRAVLMWATASVLAMLVCAALGIFLLRSIETPGAAKQSTASASVGSTAASSAPSPAKDPNRLLDLLVTGLVVGAGTKPLHDLISQIQTTSGKSKASPSSTAMSG